MRGDPIALVGSGKGAKWELHRGRELSWKATEYFILSAKGILLYTSLSLAGDRRYPLFLASSIHWLLALSSPQIYACVLLLLHSSFRHL